MEKDHFNHDEVDTTSLTDKASSELMLSELVLTAASIAKIHELMEEEGNPDLCLRVFINGGGCSGLQYGFTFDEVKNDDDLSLSVSGVKLLVDPMSYQYLSGAVIDYVNDVNGAQFVIKNPNAKTTCGCGSSFTV